MRGGRKYLLVVCSMMLMMAQLQSFAQSDTIHRKSIGNDSVVVTNVFVPVISEGIKLSYPPKQPQIKTEKTPVTYTVPVTVAPVNYPPISIKPLAINKEKPEEFPGSYLKLGFGTQYSPLAELFFTGRKMNGEDEKLDYGIFFHHLSAYGQNIKNQEFIDNDASVYVNLYPSKKLKVGARLDFDNNSVFYYGYNHSDSSFTKSQVKQSFNYGDLDLNLTNAQPGKLGVDHESHVLLYGMEDRYSQHDLGADLYTDLQKTFLEQHTIFLHAEDFYSNFGNSIGSYNNNILNIKPGYRYNGDNWNAHGAFGLGFDNGTFRPLPDLGAQWAIVPDYFIIYGDWKMELRKLTYHDLELRNPWVEADSFNLKNTRFMDAFAGLKGTRFMDAFAGLKGTVAKGLTYDVQFAYKMMQSLPLFLNDPSDTRKFLVFYNPGKLKVFDIGWGLEYRVNSNLDFGFHGDYNIYSVDSIKKAWNMPALNCTFTVRYNIAQKIFLKLDVMGISKRYAGIAANNTYAGLLNATPVQLNGTGDINLGATYKFSKYFSFFIELNNLANIKYQVYDDYPSFGINGKIGVIFTYQK